MKRKSLDTWIAEAMADTDKEGKLSQIVLVHMVGLQQKEIHTTKFSTGKNWTARDLAEMFRNKAESYCQDLPGAQTFQLLAFYSKNEPEAFQPFTINVSAVEGSLGTEAPTEQGRLQQVMRQYESLFQQTYRKQQVLDDYTIRLLSQQGSLIDKLTKENQDAFTIVKEMLMERALSEHGMRMKELEYERRSALYEKVTGFAPALINTVTGREVFPQSAADTALIEGLADSLSENATEETIMQLAGLIKPELLGPLMSRLEQHEKKKEKQKKARKAAAIGAARSPDPEADAAGDPVMIKGDNALKRLANGGKSS